MICGKPVKLGKKKIEGLLYTMKGFYDHRIFILLFFFVAVVKIINKQKKLTLDNFSVIFCWRWKLRNLFSLLKIYLSLPFLKTKLNEKGKLMNYNEPEEEFLRASLYFFVKNKTKTTRVIFCENGYTRVA